MKRIDFIKLIGGAFAMTSFKTLTNLSNSLPDNDTLMPVAFIGHGSPMNGIEENEFSNYWKKLVTKFEKPKAIICVSAHWLTKGTAVTANPFPETIHDFGGFPDALFQVQYPAKGDQELAKETAHLIHSTEVHLDHEWGLDHGTWTVLRHMYPKADIPVIQLSIDYTQPANYHYELAKQLQSLRKKGVLIIGSGNMVHNLRMVAWDKLQEPEYGFDWAIEMNTIFKEKISNNDFKSLIDYEKLGSAAKLAIPTPDHYYPLLYNIALRDTKDDISFFNDKSVGGSLTMTSVKIG